MFVKHVGKIDMDNIIKKRITFYGNIIFDGIDPSAYSDAQNLTAFSKRSILTCLQ